MNNQLYSYLITIGDLREGLDTAQTYFDKLNAIKKYYQAIEPEIHATFQKSKFLWQGTYPCDWSRIYTPIEFQAWQTIRTKGRVVMYPQYPIENFHVDFCNPGLRLVLELDGKEYHSPEKDAIRDEKLKKLGYTVFRITGKEMARTKFIEMYELEQMAMYESIPDAFEKLEYWMLETGDGVIEAITQIHFEELREADFEYMQYPLKDLYYKFLSLCYQTLENHQS